MNLLMKLIMLDFGNVNTSTIQNYILMNFAYAIMLDSGNVNTSNTQTEVDLPLGYRTTNKLYTIHESAKSF